MTNFLLNLPKCCEEVSQKWDIERMFSDLERIKKKSLSLHEKENLCLLINRNSPDNIGKIKRGFKNSGSIRTELSRGLYQYIKDFLRQQGVEDRILSDWDWRDVRIFADDYYRIDRIVPEELLVDESDLPLPIGWIWLGAIDQNLENLPTKRTELRVMGYQPVTIFPFKVPAIRSKVTVNNPVNLREQMPQPPTYSIRECRKIKELLRGTHLVILDLGFYVDISTGSPWTRVWAKVGEYSTSNSPLMGTTHH